MGKSSTIVPDFWVPPSSGDGQKCPSCKQHGVFFSAVIDAEICYSCGWLEDKNTLSID